MGSMSEMNDLIEQMVLDIANQARQLNNLRLRMFLKWLMAHNREMQISIGKFMEDDLSLLRAADLQEKFQMTMRTWLQSLTGQSLLWEYKTITAEIGWWRDLDSFSLKLIVGSDGES